MRSIQARTVCSIWMVIVLIALATVGCDQPSDSGASDMDNLANQLEQNKQATEAAAAAEQARAAAAQAAAEKAAAEQAAAQQAAAAKAAPAADNEMSITINVKNPQALFSTPEAKAAMAGIVGKKQRRNRVEGPLQYYGAMANVRILAMDRALGWQIKSAMDFYVNTHDGKYPKTTEEFMREIVEPNLIELPELEPNQEYFYDPEDHELKIAELIDEPAAAESAAAKPPAAATPPAAN